MAKPVTKNTTYEAAVLQLNALQSNSATIQMLKKKRELFQGVNLAETAMFMERCNIKLEDVDKLNVIHVSGTKGKGSTCAFTESILRRFGYKTGFYSSPHLVHVRERIRINGRPLSENAFAKHFFSVYERLQKGAILDGAMPAYFKFLTLMAFHVFIEEKVDVAIVEVGIGGEHDCTNVIKNPVVCGVTTLDLDHTSILGKTLEEIAWQKAGIFKPGSIAIVADQSEQTMEVMVSRALEKKCQLRVAPSFEAYDWPCEELEIGIPGQHQYWNITLAMQLSKVWLERIHNSNVMLQKGENKASDQGSVLPGFRVPAEFLDGIRLCEWPGRSQVVRQGSLTYFLDGAHTPKSLQSCAAWYKWERERLKKHLGDKPLQMLLFHCTSDRTPESLLPFIADCDFDIALFCPARLHEVLDMRSDNANINQSEKEQRLRAEQNMIVWKKLTKERTHAEHFDCIERALERIESLKNDKGCEVEVLVTGSLHLVGGVLTFIHSQS
ncbi:Putative folylpolyglutamate synthase [Toxocara canis]|uniref:Folylpolyglutamate synthase n=1 Tax=Toxocara canis TaxID=6265 RepID=A0A0B2V066_TOXCA|nr:Putative folylpolyglutamate synthase [Toxocara canis]